MQTVTMICQWCHSELKQPVPPVPPIVRNGVIPEDFCGKYCESSYHKAKEVMKVQPKVCSNCQNELEYLNWFKGNHFFCHGSCIDLYDESIRNPELTSLKQKYLNKKEELSKIGADLRDIEEKVLLNRRKYWQKNSQ